MALVVRVEALGFDYFRVGGGGGGGVGEGGRKSFAGLSLCCISGFRARGLGRSEV